MDDVKKLLEKRKKTHGDFTDGAKVMQQLKGIMTCGPNWNKLTFCQRESLHMFAHKIGRILVGDPNEPDHWKDIIGYSQLVIDRIALPVPGEKNVPGTPEDGGHHEKNNLPNIVTVEEFPNLPPWMQIKYEFKRSNEAFVLKK